MRILVANVNTTESMTDSIGRQAASVASPGTEIVPLTPLFGADSVEGNYESYLAAVAVMETVRRYSEPFDAVIQAERANPEVAALVRGLRARHGAVRRRLFDRAIARGELPASTNAAALVEIVTAPIVSRIVHMGRPVEDDFIELIADVVCRGAKQ